MNTLYIKGFAGVLLLTSSAGVAEIYKCTDAQGKTRYADKPCGGSAVVITPKKAPAVTEDSVRRMDKTQRLLRAYDAEHKEEQAREAASKAENIQRQQKCGEARRYQRGVTQASRVYAHDEAGQRYDLSDEGRAAEEARARDEVARWCDDA